MVGSLGGEPPRLLMKAVANAAFVSGRLSVRPRPRARGAAVRPGSLSLEGEEVVVGDDVHVAPAVLAGPLLGVARRERSSTTAGRASDLVLKWFDRGGREIAAVGEPGLYYEFALSPDGRRTALSAEDQKTGRLDVFILDVERGVVQRLTSGKTDSSMPLWHPDGKRVVFRTRDAGLLDLWEMNLDGVADKTLLLKSDKDKEPTDVSPDGRYLAFGVSNLSIWMLPAFAPGRLPAGPCRRYSPGPRSLPQELQRGKTRAFSPDGRWVAFESSRRGEGGLRHVLPEAAGRTCAISSGGGRRRVGAPDGRELFFLTPGNTLMSAALRPQPASGSRSARRSASSTSPRESSAPTSRKDRAPPTSPGGSLPLPHRGEGPGPHPLTLVTNWTAALERR